MTDQPVTLHNVPNIQDVNCMRKLLESMGMVFEDLGHSSLRISSMNISPATLDPELCKKIRASILLAGPTVARSGMLHLPPPGGDVIGRRRVDTHLLALRKLGVTIDYDRSFHFKVERLKGADILLDEASVTATEMQLWQVCWQKEQPSSVMQLPSLMSRNFVFF